MNSDIQAPANPENTVGTIQTTTPKRNTLWIFVSGIGLLVFILIIIVIFIRANGSNDSDTPSVKQMVTPSPTLTPKPAALESLTFPDQTINYPINWPTQLHYPSQFYLVEARDGTLPDGTSQGWSAQLRYEGTPQNAAASMTVFFTEMGWTVKQESNDEVIMLLVELPDKTGTGILVIEPAYDRENSTYILATIRL